jgi:fructokinase
MSDFRIGIDLGGTKVEIIALTHQGEEKHRRRIPAPKVYDEVVATLADMVRQAEHALGGTGSVGIGIPGCISPATGLVKNASSTGLIGYPFDRDMGAVLNREVRVENDANCFALSEAVDGAGAGAKVVFGVILGTGVGGGIVINGQLVEGRHRIAGEWGHNSLPWPSLDEVPGRKCWCGQYGCLETMLSGTGLAVECDGPGAKDASTIPARAAAGDAQAIRALEVHSDRLARALAQIVNLLDPDVIVLGGGVSNLEHLYVEVPRLMPRHVYSDVFNTPIVRNVHGDSSGVRGAAWLWPANTG